MTAGLALGWWLVMVNGGYGGNWTALFCSGTKHPVPPQLAGDHVYQFPGGGFDGQFYHDMAFDPALTRGVVAYMDDARLRYRRILVPGLAFVLALGNPARIDAAYFLVTLAFILAGAYWLAACLVRLRRNPAWTLAFLLVPAILMGLVRMTVPDMALTALTAGFCFYVERDGGANWKLYLILVLASLARETGLLLAMAYVGWLVLNRRIPRAAVFATAVLPWLAWSLYVYVRTEEYSYPHAFTPFRSVLELAREPLEYARSFGLAVASRALDWVALAGAWLAIVWALPLLRDIRKRPTAVACLAFALLSAYLLSIEDWQRTYDYGRVFSPLYLMLTLEGLRAGSLRGALPGAMIVPRMGILVASELLTIAGKLVR